MSNGVKTALLLGVLSAVFLFLGEAIGGAQAVIQEQLGALAAQLPAGEEEGVLVLNPDCSPRPVRVTLAQPFPGAQVQITIPERIPPR